MTSYNEFNQRWNEASSLFNHHQTQQALDLLYPLIPIIEHLEELRPIPADVDMQRHQAETALVKTMCFTDILLMLAHHGDFKTAHVYAEKALSLQNEWQLQSFTALQVYLAMLYLNEQKFKQSIAIANQVLNSKIYLTDKDKVPLYINLGLAYYFLNDIENAEHTFLDIIISPIKSFEPYYFLSEIYTQKHDEKLAKKYSKMAITRSKKLEKTVFMQTIQFFPEAIKQRVEDWYNIHVLHLSISSQ